MATGEKYKIAQAFGKTAEKMAAEFYKSKGYAVEKMNFTCKYGEIDVIARKNKELIFAEVKARGKNSIARPCEFVTPTKQKRILKTALIYLKQIGSDDFYIRFDVVEAISKDGKITLNCIENAFDASALYK